MSVWSVVKNIGTILSLFRAIKELISFVATQKKMPDAGTFKSVLDHVQSLLDSGAIDIPGVDEHDISAAIQQLEDFLMKASAESKAA